MVRELLPLVDNKPPYLRGFHCSKCDWSYMQPVQQADYLEFLSDGRELFRAHDCNKYRLDVIPSPSLHNINT